MSAFSNGREHQRAKHQRQQEKGDACRRPLAKSLVALFDESAKGKAAASEWTDNCREGVPGGRRPECMRPGAEEDRQDRASQDREKQFGKRPEAGEV